MQHHAHRHLNSILLGVCIKFWVTCRKLAYLIQTWLEKRSRSVWFSKCLWSYNISNTILQLWHLLEMIQSDYLTCFSDCWVRWATEKHRNTGKEMEITKRCSESKPVSWPYSREEHGFGGRGGQRGHRPSLLKSHPTLEIVNTAWGVRTGLVMPPHQAF